MKKKILLAFSLIAVFCFGMIASAYTTRTNASDAAMSCCCCKGDSCPMKSKGEEKATEHKSGEHKEGDSNCCCKK